MGKYELLNEYVFPHQQHKLSHGASKLSGRPTRVEVGTSSSGLTFYSSNITPGNPLPKSLFGKPAQQMPRTLTNISAMVAMLVPEV